MAAHALLSPSGAERWLSCPPSARLEENFPDRAGRAAEEGTLAHALAELLLLERTKQINDLQYKSRLKTIQANTLYEPAMLTYVEDYVAFVIERYSEALAHTPTAKIYLEHKINLTAFIPEGFGTGDVIIIADTILDVIDFKYGKGVPVSADENKQMMTYGIGTLVDFDFMYDIQKVRMTICQPRLDSISTYELTVDELRDWAENELKPKAALAWEGKGEYTPGKHCRFCKAAGICKANADVNMLVVKKHDFADGVLMKDEDVSDVLLKADIIRKWLTAVDEYALEQAKTGKKWPGLKLVAGRSNRSYSDPEAVIKALVKAKISTRKGLLKTPEIVSITELEKLIGKAVFNAKVSPLLIKPPGAPTLVVLGDKRPELSSVASAAEDFADVDV